MNLGLKVRKKNNAGVGRSFGAALLRMTGGVLIEKKDLAGIESCQVCKFMFKMMLRVLYV